MPGSAEQARFQILALDGGGAKALFTAHVLARLEQDLRVRLVDAFDLIAGTSAGGIVALGLGAGLQWALTALVLGPARLPADSRQAMVWFCSRIHTAPIKRFLL